MMENEQKIAGKWYELLIFASTPCLNQNQNFSLRKCWLEMLWNQTQFIYVFLAWAANIILSAKQKPVMVCEVWGLLVVGLIWQQPHDIRDASPCVFYQPQETGVFLIRDKEPECPTWCGVYCHCSPWMFYPIFACLCAEWVCACVYCQPRLVCVVG